jgi:hypothetical protein
LPLVQLYSYCDGKYTGTDIPVAIEVATRLAAQEQRRGNMKIASMLLIALLAGLSVATWSSQASAAAGRDAAITRCIAKAQRQFPTNRRYNMSNRAFSYKACMHAAGFRP